MHNLYNKESLKFSRQVYPSQLPDLSSESPLILSGRYRGAFPDNLTVTGSLVDMGNLSLDLKVQEAEGIPLDKVRSRSFVLFFLASHWDMNWRKISFQERQAPSRLKSSRTLNALPTIFMHPKNSVALKK